MTVPAPHIASQTPWALPAICVYPERVQPEISEFDRIARSVLAYVAPVLAQLPPVHSRAAIVRVTESAGVDLVALSDAALREHLRGLRPILSRALRRTRPKRKTVALAFAAIRECADRTLKQRPFDVQILAAWAMLNGTIAEMRTGEGKSLTATLAAGTLALGGVSVHVMTVNDYLAQRDYDSFAPLYHALGLTVGLVLEGQTPDQRRRAYACDVVHCTAKEIVFDYLRDRGSLRTHPGNLARKVDRILVGEGAPTSGLVMRGLTAAIIDEADSVLIDQACTPFILSGGVTHPGGLAPDILRRAMLAARDLTLGRDFRVLARHRIAELTDAGRDVLAQTLSQAQGPLSVAAIREHAATQALNALHVFERDRDYLIEADKIKIIDESTGRVMGDRTWSEGLHQMVELKEDVPLTHLFETIARITLQKFFRRYIRLGGMTGTARSAARELWDVYGMRVRRIPTRLPDQRIWDKAEVHATLAEKWAAITGHVQQLQARGAPILIGAKTVGGSQDVSDALREAAHQVLNAHNHAEEAAIIAQAGLAGRVTVATNMAGRGTDIKLTPEAKAAGGLHVLLTELHDSRRVDLQLSGRCGRQGDPGRVMHVLSLQDDILARRGAAMRAAARWTHRAGWPRITLALLRHCQSREDARQAKVRVDLLIRERQRDVQLAISGYTE
jgi:preprotein translocase subunit SecA